MTTRGGGRGVSSPPTSSAIRLGVVFPPFVDPVELPRYAALVEELGFQELWVVEDCFLAGGFACAATALAVTRSLRVGLGLIPASVRNPAIAAMEIATLARLYPARFAIAVGRGVQEWMSQIGAGSARTLGELSATVSAVTALLKGQRISLSAEHFALDEVQLDFIPDVLPPVLIGTTGPKGLALAGRIADGIVLAEGCVPGFVRWAVDVASPRHCVVYAWLSLDDDFSAAEGRLFPAAERWFRHGVFPHPRDFAFPSGREPRRSDLARLGVCGDAAACAAAVNEFADAGTTSLIFYIPSEQRAQLERFSREVMPLLGSQGT